jgi:hypothetical protein
VCGSSSIAGLAVRAPDDVDRAGVVEAGAWNTPSSQAARWSASTASRPVERNRCSCSAVSPPSRPFISNSSRSKLDDTWMSMLGLSVGTTSAVLMSLSRRTG